MSFRLTSGSLATYSTKTSIRVVAPTTDNGTRPRSPSRCKWQERRRWATCMRCFRVVVCLPRSHSLSIPLVLTRSTSLSLTRLSYSLSRSLCLLLVASYFHPGSVSLSHCLSHSFDSDLPPTRRPSISRSLSSSVSPPLSLSLGMCVWGGSFVRSLSLSLSFVHLTHTSG